MFKLHAHELHSSEASLEIRGSMHSVQMSQSGGFLDAQPWLEKCLSH
jgi:hypothetical protein